MKKKLIVFLILILTKQFLFCQTTYPKKFEDSLILITHEQAKKINIVFLKKEQCEELLVIQKRFTLEKDSLIKGYKQNISIYQYKDSLNTQLVSNLKEQLSLEKRQLSKTRKILYLLPIVFSLSLFALLKI